MMRNVTNIFEHSISKTVTYYTPVRTTKLFYYSQFSRLATGWTFRGSNPAQGEIFCTRADQPTEPPRILYSGYHVPFPGLKRTGLGVDNPPPPSAEVKERVDLHLYYFTVSAVLQHDLRNASTSKGHLPELFICRNDTKRILEEAQISEIYNVYGEYCAVKFIELGTLTWAGHVMRIEESDPAKKVVCTKPGGSKYRRKGRQKLT